MRQLNNTQKQWLFDRHYMTAKVLDACVEPGWQDYYINCFNWMLDDSNVNGWYHLILQAKDGSCYYHADLNLRKEYKILIAVY